MAKESRSSEVAGNVQYKTGVILMANSTDFLGPRMW